MESFEYFLNTLSGKFQHLWRAITLDNLVSEFVRWEIVQEAFQKVAINKPIGRDFRITSPSAISWSSIASE